jgi:uncharacterized membrane protein
MKKILFAAILCIAAYIPINAQYTYYRHEPWMDRYLKGKFGLNPNLDEKGNRDFYERMGYTYSTTIPDKTIYIYSGIAIVIIFGSIYYFSTKKSFETVN